MALIKCPECGNEMSDTAKSCPKCGYLLKKFNLVKHKKISTYVLVIGIILFVGIIIWSVNTSSEDLAVYTGYYFGNATSASEWRDYQVRHIIEDIFLYIGFFAIIVGIVYKIVIKVKGSNLKK